MTIAVTGATGVIGGGVFARLAERQEVRLVGRDGSRLSALAGTFPDASVAVAHYGDAAAMESALAGVNTMLLVSAHESPTRRDDHATAVAAAVRAGVGRIVYLSFLGAGPECTFTFGRDHWYTEQEIRESGVAHTFLRDSWYQSMIPAMVDDEGVIRGPAGDGRVSAVAPADVVDSAAEVVEAGAERDPSPYDGETYELTGPAAFTLAEAATQLSDVTGTTIRYAEETIEEAYLSREVYDAPKWEVDGWVTSYAAVATGELSTVTDDVSMLTGRPATSFAQYLHDHPESWARLR
ncbi:SDR family NAD(P)-dependent oxidoreductase [Rhodococcus rhodnii]|uniref:NAD(P)-binding domain-containing protein n=2 Tax=Rhodococcus rhodnii TaxID=38312 RepID=R7WK06_9NOCA|nr:NAD(P)H-binding protein [Rhodococcus rhodnii]EOM74299.1 hypothetical protein Rrhod_4443 [Rhodococcus rhodnii LMG 5362]TXG89562.1 SDR family NAD(P)-dependent oxidoreductase [Rhodococcus rhodnii]